jgi:hypothetical protein
MRGEIHLDALQPSARLCRYHVSTMQRRGSVALVHRKISGIQRELRKLETIVPCKTLLFLANLVQFVEHNTCRVQPAPSKHGLSWRHLQDLFPPVFRFRRSMFNTVCPELAPTPRLNCSLRVMLALTCNNCVSTRRLFISLPVDICLQYVDLPVIHS